MEIYDSIIFFLVYFINSDDTLVYKGLITNQDMQCFKFHNSLFGMHKMQISYFSTICTKMLLME